MISLTEAKTPSFISCLTTSEAVFFMREASSPTLISSGICTFSGCFLAISSCRRFILSRSSCRRLAEEACWLLGRCLALLPIFCLAPPRMLLALALVPAISSNFSLYFSMLTAAPPLVSTTRFSATWRGVWGLLGFSCFWGAGCCGAAGAAGLAWAAACCWGAGPFWAAGAAALP